MEVEEIQAHIFENPKEGGSAPQNCKISREGNKGFKTKRFPQI